MSSPWSPVGAPSAPDPASIYNGEQIIIVKTDGAAFSNGDPWKCITCGIPEANRIGASGVYDYPQAFSDGKRILGGDNVVDCGEHDLSSDDCTPDVTFIYPIRWETSPDGEGEGGPLRELRLHPDDVHLGFSAFSDTDGQMGQNAYFSRIVFNASPTTGLPLAPRYDVVNVTVLRDPHGGHSVRVDGDELYINSSAISVGELRGFSGRGHEAVYIGYPSESANTDAYTVHLQTGEKRRLTTHPEYVDPIDVSPDDQWSVILDTRGSNRQMFIAGMRGIPPLLDLVISRLTTGTRNNGPRRFFQPFLLDRWGDRGDYFGQKLNGPGRGIPGSGDIDDPEWNVMAEPRWSPDMTGITYWQAQTISPQCGGPNPLPCYPSTAPGGRTYRLMLAKLTSREPKHLPPVEEAPDTVPWGIPYVPGGSIPATAPPAAGNYRLEGKVAGYADVSLIKQSNSSLITGVAARYYDFSDGGVLSLNGWENATTEAISFTVSRTHWFSDLVQSGGGYNATKVTSADGLHAELDVMRNYFSANGTLTTTINGVVYEQPLNGT